MYLFRVVGWAALALPPRLPCLAFLVSRVGSRSIAAGWSFVVGQASSSHFAQGSRLTPVVVVTVEQELETYGLSSVAAGCWHFLWTNAPERASNELPVSLCCWLSGLPDQTDFVPPSRC